MLGEHLDERSALRSVLPDQVPYLDDFRWNYAFGTASCVGCLQLWRAIPRRCRCLVELLGKVGLARVLLLGEHRRHRVGILNLDVHHWITASLHTLEHDRMLRYDSAGSRGIDSFHAARWCIGRANRLGLRCRLEGGAFRAGRGVHGTRIARSVRAALRDLSCELLC